MPCSAADPIGRIVRRHDWCMSGKADAAEFIYEFNTILLGYAHPDERTGNTGVMYDLLVVGFPQPTTDSKQQATGVDLPISKKNRLPYQPICK